MKSPLFILILISLFLVTSCKEDAPAENSATEKLAEVELKKTEETNELQKKIAAEKIAEIERIKKENKTFSPDELSVFKVFLNTGKELPVIIIRQEQ